MHIGGIAETAPLSSITLLRDLATMLSLKFIVKMLAIAAINLFVIKAAPSPYPSEKPKEFQRQKRKEWILARALSGMIIKNWSLCITVAS